MQILHNGAFILGLHLENKTWGVGLATYETFKLKLLTTNTTRWFNSDAKIRFSSFPMVTGWDLWLLLVCLWFKVKNVGGILLHNNQMQINKPSMKELCVWVICPGPMLQASLFCTHFLFYFGGDGKGSLKITMCAMLTIPKFVRFNSLDMKIIRFWLWLQVLVNFLRVQ